MCTNYTFVAYLCAGVQLKTNDIMKKVQLLLVTMLALLTLRYQLPSTANSLRNISIKKPL